MFRQTDKPAIIMSSNPHIEIANDFLVEDSSHNEFALAIDKDSGAFGMIFSSGGFREIVMADMVSDALRLAKPSAKIRHVRKERGFSQEHLAELMEMSSTALAYWERGERNIKAVDLEKIFRICGF